MGASAPESESGALASACPPGKKSVRHRAALRASVARNRPAIAQPAHGGDRPARFSLARTVSCQGHGPVGRAVLPGSPLFLVAGLRPTTTDTRFPVVTPAPTPRLPWARWPTSVRLA